MSRTLQLSSSPVHISTRANASFEVLDWFKFDESSWQRYVTDHCSSEDPGCIVMEEASPVSWPTWECHPKGDELVIVLAGRGTFYQQLEGAEVAMPFQAGDTILNPRGVWHTADVTEAMRAIYITTCPDTDHKPRA